MVRSARSPESLSLAQEKADFTAEGAPPPGRVATAVPATVPAKAVPAVHGPRGRKRWPTPGSR